MRISFAQATRSRAEDSSLRRGFRPLTIWPEVAKWGRFLDEVATPGSLGGDSFGGALEEASRRDVSSRRARATFRRENLEREHIMKKLTMIAAFVGLFGVAVTLGVARANGNPGPGLMNDGGHHVNANGDNGNSNAMNDGGHHVNTNGDNGDSNAMNDGGHHINASGNLGDSNGMNDAGHPHTNGNGNTNPNAPRIELSNGMNDAGHPHATKNEQGNAPSVL